MKAFIALVFFLPTLASLGVAQDLTSIDFHVRDIHGKQHSFQKYLDHVRNSGEKGAIVLSFWAMWCEPCKQEMRALVPVFEKYRDENLHFIAINMDNPRSLAKVRAYVSAQKLPYEFWLDPNSEVFKLLNGQSMPYSLIVNQHGKLIAKRTGYIAGDEHEIEDDIKQILR